jgi:hypothetical protein
MDREVVIVVEIWIAARTSQSKIPNHAYSKFISCIFKLFVMRFENFSNFDMNNYPWQ